MSGRRDSNPRQPAWEADTLPTELRPQIIFQVYLLVLKLKLIILLLPTHMKNRRDRHLSNARTMTKLNANGILIKIFFTIFSEEIY